MVKNKTCIIVDDIIEPIQKQKLYDYISKTRTNDPSESSAPFKIYNIGNNNPKKLMFNPEYLARQEK